MPFRFVTTLACLGLFGTGFVMLRTGSPDAERGSLDVDPPTPYVRFIPDGQPHGRVLVVHGLNASKETMKPLGMAFAEGGFDAWLVDSPGHGDSSEAISFDRTVAMAGQVLDDLGPDTILVGHSMGGAVLAELAAGRDVGTMVLYSPAPLVAGEVRAERLLIVSGGLEAPIFDETIPRILDRAGDRAYWWRFPWAAHSSGLARPDMLQAVVRWLGGDPERGRPGGRALALALMTVAGLAFPMTLGLARQKRDFEPGYEAPVARRVLVEWVAVVFIAAVVAGRISILGWAHIFAVDHALGVVLIGGLFAWRGRDLFLSARGFALAVAAAAYVIVVFGFGVASHFVDVMPAGTQWIRLPILTLAVLPMFLYDEYVVRGIASPLARAATLLTTRAVLWSGVVTSALVLNREAGFLLMVFHLMLLFWLVLWGIAGFVVRRTGEPAAGALFAALVQGWVLAAVLVRTS